MTAAPPNTQPAPIPAPSPGRVRLDITRAAGVCRVRSIAGGTVTVSGSATTTVTALRGPSGPAWKRAVSPSEVATGQSTSGWAGSPAAQRTLLIGPGAVTATDTDSTGTSHWSPKAFQNSSGSPSGAFSRPRIS